ncbi:MAG TPA: response regulator, partial [Polyangia bacterium]
MANWILVVEDDELTRESLVDLLNSSGFAAFGAASVLDAFEVMVGKRPSLVLSDINLGDHHGGELLDMAMKILGDEAPPFVFVTGMSA